MGEEEGEEESSRMGKEGQDLDRTKCPDPEKIDYEFDRLQTLTSEPAGGSILQTQGPTILT